MVLRTVWVFPLRPIDLSGEPKVSESNSVEVQNRQRRVAAKLPDDELLKRASTSLKKPGSRPTVTKQFTRNANVAEYAERRADGMCEFCEAPALLKTSEGNPFLRFTISYGLPEKAKTQSTT